MKAHFLLKDLLKAVSLLTLLLAISGCVTEKTTSRGPVEEVDKQKVLAKQVDLGFRYLGRDNLDKARFHLGKALKIDSRSSRANTGFALIYNKEGEQELADQHFRKALSGSANNTQARFYYAVFLLEQQRIKAAQKQLVKVTSDVDFNNRALAFLSLGQVEVKLGNPEAARTAFDKTLRLNGNMALAYLEIAELEYIDGNFENSINYLSNYRRLVRRPNARSLWLGVRVAYKRDNGDAMSSYGLALEKMFPESRENLAYQQWRKRL